MLKIQAKKTFDETRVFPKSKARRPVPSKEDAPLA
jgi:hypothetical protein